MQAIGISCIEGKLALLQGIEGSDPSGRDHWITSGQLPFLTVLRVYLTRQGQRNGKDYDKRSVSVHMCESEKINYERLIGFYTKPVSGFCHDFRFMT